MLKFIKDATTIKNKRMAEYMCDCGDISVYIKTVVKNGRKTVCKKCSFNKQAKERTMNLVGQTFGRWKVLHFNEEKISKYRGVEFICECECGNTLPVLSNSLVMGKSKQCLQCAQKQSKRDNNEKSIFKDNMPAESHRIYRIWKNMKSRCYSGHNSRHYLDEGVYVCDEWKNDFKSFYDWAMANGYTDNVEIDKDILCDELQISPKYYGHKTCIFISKSINAAYATTKDLVIKQKMRKKILGY